MKYLDVPQSGSIAATTASRNRYGQYYRTRATPVNPNSPAQAQARARLAAQAAAWRALTEVQRTGWEALGLLMVRTDSLGKAYTLNGFTAYCSVNKTRVDAGDAAVADAPALVTPDALTTLTPTMTAATATLAFAPTPLPALTKAFVFASPQVSAGRSFNSDYRLITVSAAAAATPLNVFTPYQTRLGTPVVGNKVFFQVQTYRAGFLSGPILASVVVA